LDELTTTGPNRISQYLNGEVTSYELDPTDYDLKPAHISDLVGGDAPTNAAILRGILNGSVNSSKRDVVILNAGAAMIAGGLANDIAEGMEIAHQTIDSGAALAKLNQLIQYSQEIVRVH
jgi:anthranilate phosphoribosyltransferase